MGMQVLMDVQVAVHVADRERYAECMAKKPQALDARTFASCVNYLSDYYREAGTELRLFKDRAPLSMEFLVVNLKTGTQMAGGIIWDEDSQRFGVHT